MQLRLMLQLLSPALQVLLFLDSPTSPMHLVKLKSPMLTVLLHVKTSMISVSQVLMISMYRMAGLLLVEMA